MATVSSIDTGSSNITTLGTITTGTWSATAMTFAQGGLAQANTASNGGIAYSTASVISILAGTATAGQMLLSGASTTPAWSTVTWPSTVTQYDILYASAANKISSLAIQNYSILCFDLNSLPTWVSMNTNGVILIGSTNATPVAATITAGNGISISTGAGSTSVNLVSAVNQNSSSVTMSGGNTYLINNGASLVTLTLAASPTAGDIYYIIGASSGGWTIAQNASQAIKLPGGVTTTAGVGGSLSSNNQYDCVTITYSEISNTFVATNIIGNIIYV